MREPTQILIAEDNAADVRLIRIALEEASGWQPVITVARDGDQAISMLHEMNPDLVILDYNLPKRSGTHVLKAIRENNRLKTTSVVVLSSSPEYFLREKMRDAHVEA